MDSINPFELVILILAVFRMTRLVTKDTILGEYPTADDPEGSGFHGWLDRWAYDDEGNDRGFLRGKIGDLLECPWCVGVWASAIGWYIWTLDIPWVRAATIIAAIAGAQGFIASRHNA